MQSETIGAIAAALAKAQGAIKPAVFDKEVNTNTYKFKYATLANLWDTARDALSANGLAVVQTTDIGTGGDIVLLTTLLHSSGEWIGGVYPVRAKDNTPQALGSAITYARRYSLSALLGLVSDDDDDGNAATGNAAQTSKAPYKAQNGGANAKPAGVVAKQPIRNDNLTAGDDSGKGNPFTEDEAAALRKLHAIGKPMYGAEWDAKRHAGALWASNKRTNSSKQLTLEELNKLIAELEERERQAQAVPA